MNEENDIFIVSSADMPCTVNLTLGGPISSHSVENSPSSRASNSFFPKNTQPGGIRESDVAWLPNDPDISHPSNEKVFQVIPLNQLELDNPSAYRDSVSRRNYRFLWTFAANSILGLMLLTGPAMFDYGRQALSVSDTICGAMVLLFEALAFFPRTNFMRWGTVAVAFWLLLAPLIFWAPQPAVYLVDTLTGALLITFSVLIPGVPRRGDEDVSGVDRPPGWTYNPSSWIRRWLGIALALVGFLISRYLAAKQLGYITHAHDPFFDGGTDKVLTSALSRSLPVSDAGFGGVAYVLEMLAGFLGDRARWRTAPWIVLMFGLLVIPLGITSIMLVVMQPVVVHSWCGLCLVAAVALLASVPLAVHEVIAVGQLLVYCRARGKNVWNVFWSGAIISGAGAPDPDRLHYSLMQRWISSVQGVTLEPTTVAQIALGSWLMARPDVIQSDLWSANLDHLLGALAVTFAAIASAEVTRAARLLNVFVGGALVVLALCGGQERGIVLANDIVCGALLMLLAIPRGRIFERYAGWDRFIK